MVTSVVVTERVERLKAALVRAKQQGDLVQQAALLKKLISEAADAAIRFRAELLGTKLKKGGSSGAAREGVKQSQQDKKEFRQELQSVRFALKKEAPLKSFFSRRRGL